MRERLAAGLDAPPPARSAQLALALARVFGDSTLAIIHYGSHAHRSDARPESAPDYFIIVAGYRAAYRSVAATVGTSYRPATAALLNRVLPPNVIAVAGGRDAGAQAVRGKCAILSLGDFRRACSARAKDHFVLGRLFQQAQVAWARDVESRAAVVDAVVAARVQSFRWGRPYLPARFDAETYCRVLLETSFAAEIRPEAPGRIRTLLDAQQATIVPMYAGLLQWLADNGVLESHRGDYFDSHPPGRWSRLRTAAYFRVSKLRATVRWAKYVTLYDDWLDYVLQKVARRSDVAIELTERERRWPLIFLWPKALRFLRSRPQRRS